MYVAVRDKQISYTHLGTRRLGPLELWSL